MKIGTPFPHNDIPDKGPPLSAVLCPFGRDDAEYRGHPDHDANGLLHGGPGGEHCTLAKPQGFTFCAHPDRTVPENERKGKVATRGRFMTRARAWRDAGEDASDEYADKYRTALAAAEPPRQRMVWAGRFLFAGRPANSGRKRKSA